MNATVPALSEDAWYTVSADLESLGLRKGDRISVVPLDFYAAGDVVIALIDGFYQIGKLRLSDTKMELVTPADDHLEVSSISLDAIAGFVQKDHQEIIAD